MPKHGNIQLEKNLLAQLTSKILLRLKKNTCLSMCLFREIFTRLKHISKIFLNCKNYLSGCLTIKGDLVFEKLKAFRIERDLIFNV